MDIDTELILEYLAEDNTERLQNEIDRLLKNDIQSDKDWKEFVNILRIACSKTFQKHWLKTHQVLFSTFNIPELLGVDCNVFEELSSVLQPTSIDNVSNKLFDVLVEISKTQLRSGGSTLFFDIDKISMTRSAVIISDLIDARYRETVLVLSEIDSIILSLTKEWVKVPQLWRTGNGFRLLKASDLGLVIHIKEYNAIRNILLKELKIDSKKFHEIRNDFGNVDYLQLSENLNEFVTGLIASRGIRGTYEPHFKTWINHEGLDEF
ncbi:MAG: hypothetical protein ACW99G_10085 [Candidatus Thorarchaeota archaeon]|jgi:hypothetical protein